MPVEVDSRMSTTPFPSFMSVVGNTHTHLTKDMEDIPAPDTITSDTQLLVTDAKPPSVSLQQSTSALYHRDSITSMTSASTESSPTTTNSTFDSPLMTDQSPSSSPESASSNAPISPFTHLALNPSQEGRRNHPQPGALRPELPTFTHGHMGVVSDNTKNVKNLSLNINTVVIPRPATAHGFEASHTFSAPTSPLKDAPRTGRRKPTNLTIRTPGFQQLAFPRALDVPPTPSSRPMLHHMASSPALASLASPTKPPPQGLFLHLPPTAGSSSGPNSGSTSASSSSAQAGNNSLPGLKEEDESHGLKSQETQEKGYPNGPVLIYDEGLYLYLEPTADEASKFDTVINVAKEIKCPFDLELVRPEVTEPQTAISEMSFKSAWEWPRPTEVPTPTTPRPTSFYQKDPEYLHVPWDHNSEILEDLYSLCRLIDDRIRAGKKVLIHCQLGVSRSASLVIAYGLYKGYRPDFHSMYMAVKGRSEWVGPNMSLIYQLADFRAKVVNSAYGDRCYQPLASWWKIRPSNEFMIDTPVANQSRWPPATTNEMTVSENAPTPVTQTRTFTPPTVKVAPPSRLNKSLPPVPLFSKEAQMGTPLKLSQILGGIAKPNTPPSQERPHRMDVYASQPASPRPLPFREQFENMSSSDVVPPPAKSPRLGLKIESPRMDLAMQDVPETPSLLSPRATEFRASPFGITVAGDLAASNVRTKVVKPNKGALMPRHQVILPPSNSVKGDGFPTSFDPRSPHQHGETGEILRHIDDFL